VLNPQATSGGAREAIPVVTQDDYDAAVVDLQNRLTGQLAELIDDEGVVPEGLVLYPETAARGAAINLPSADGLVGQSLERFDLGSEAVATVLAVDEDMVKALAAARLEGQVPDGSSLLPGSVATEAGRGTADGGLIRYAVIASGDIYSVLDRDQMVALVKGKTISDARSILAPYGSVTISIWPEFLGNVPEDAGRIELSIEDPTEGSGDPSTSTAACQPSMAARVILGVDLGEARIGIAIGDAESGRVYGLATLRRRDPARDAASLSRLCREHGATTVVVGLPLLLDDSEGPQATATRDWAAQVGPQIDLPITFRDERFTSQQAEERLGRQPRGRSGGPPSSAARQARRDASIGRRPSRSSRRGRLLAGTAAS
jgi:putative Holliday junction resolvase